MDSMTSHNDDEWDEPLTVRFRLEAGADDPDDDAMPRSAPPTAEWRKMLTVALAVLILHLESLRAQVKAQARELARLRAQLARDAAASFDRLLFAGG
jgi:hypothetical protein